MSTFVFAVLQEQGEHKTSRGIDALNLSNPHGKSYTWLKKSISLYGTVTLRLDSTKDHSDTSPSRFSLRKVSGVVRSHSSQRVTCPLPFATTDAVEFTVLT